jgi:hypothetical protein
MKTRSTIILSLLVFSVICTRGFSQDFGPAEPPPPPEGRDGRGPREGGPPPPPPIPPEERLRAQIQALLGSSDAEWSVLEPQIARVQALIAERERFTKPKPPKPARDGRGPDGRGPDGRGPDGRGSDGRGPDGRGPEGNRGEWQIQSPITDLKSDPKKDAQPGTVNGNLLQLYVRLVTLASSNVSDAELQNALTQYRTARAASDAQLAQARDELRQLLTTRQEVVLVAMGILE